MPLTAFGEERLWSSPRVLQTHDDCVSETVEVIATGRGRWRALWDDRNPSCDSRYEYRLRTATRNRRSGWKRRAPLPQGFELPALKVAGADAVQTLKRGRALLLGARPAVGRSPSQLNRVLQVATISSGGHFRRRDLDSGRLLYGSDGDFGSHSPTDVDDTPPAVELAPDGRGVAVWARLVDDDETNPRGRLYARYRRGNGRFGAARPLGPAGQPTAAAVAVNRHGDAAVAWCQDGSDLLFRFRARGEGWGSVQRVGECGNLSTALDVALADDGRPVIAWSSESRTSGDDQSRSRSGVRVATGEQGSFDQPRVISREGDSPRVMATSRGAAIAWSVPIGAESGVFFARIGRRGRVTKSRVSKDGPYRLVDLEATAMRPRGLLMWGRSNELLARRIRADGSLDGIEFVSSTSSTNTFGAVRLGLDWRGEAFAILGHNRTDTRGVPRSSTVEAARR